MQKKPETAPNEAAAALAEAGFYAGPWDDPAGEARKALNSDDALRAAIKDECPLVAYRYVAEWNEYQLAPKKKGRADWESVQTTYIPKPCIFARDEHDAAEARAEVLRTAQWMQKIYSTDFQKEGQQ